MGGAVRHSIINAYIRSGRIINPTERETGEKTREKTREKIFNAIRESPNITTSELAEKLTITIKGVEWQLKNLREQGFIRRVGPDKGGHWEILKETL